MIARSEARLASPDVLPLRLAVLEVEAGSALEGSWGEDGGVAGQVFGDLVIW